MRLRSGAVVCLLALVGCGGGQLFPEDNYQHVCESTVFRSAASEIPIDCATLDANAQLAVRMLSDRGLAASEALLPAMADVDMRVRDEATWNYDGLTDLRGLYAHGDIYTNPEGLSLLHEMLHGWDVASGRGAGTRAHEGWGERGYWGADLLFRFEAHALGSQP